METSKFLSINWRDVLHASFLAGAAAVGIYFAHEFKQWLDCQFCAAEQPFSKGNLLDALQIFAGGFVGILFGKLGINSQGQILKKEPKKDEGEN